MCYTLLLSTSSDEDLALHNNDLVRFSRDLPSIAAADHLKYAHRWYVGSQAGCSCTFRHSMEQNGLGFQEPVEWWKEEPEPIDATLQLIAIIRGLLASGHTVDCVDVFGDLKVPGPDRELEVDLSTVSNAAFRFFENYHFVFMSTG
jgi:hypothetical protein